MQLLLLTLGRFTLPFDLILQQILSSVGLVGLFKNRPNNNLLHIEQVQHIRDPNNQLWLLIFEPAGINIVTIWTIPDREQFYIYLFIFSWSVSENSPWGYGRWQLNRLTTRRARCCRAPTHRAERPSCRETCTDKSLQLDALRKKSRPISIRRSVLSKTK